MINMGTLLKGWTNLWAFVAGAFQDDAGHTSTTRISTYLIAGEVVYYINNTPKPDQAVLLQLFLLLTALLGFKTAKDIKGTQPVTDEAK
jgi:hypothetical protein